MEKNKKESSYSEYKVIIFNVNGMTVEDLKKAFADYKVIDIRISEKSSNPSSPPAFITFANPDEQKKALKGRIIVKNKKLVLKPFKVKDPKREASEIALIKQTINITDQKVLEFSVKGHSSDQIIDLSVRKLNFKFVITNKTILPKKILYIGFTSSRFFKCSFKLKVPRILQPYSNLEVDVVFEHNLTEPASCFTTLMVQTDKHRYPYPLTFNVSSLDDMKLIAKKGEYVEKDDLTVPDEIIRAPPIERASKTHVHTKVETFYIVELGQYPVPAEIHKAIMEKDAFYDFNPWRSKEQWKQRLHQLLWFEEVELEKRSHRFDLRNVTIPQISHQEVLKDGRLDAQMNYSEIAVPGLADNRPSVLYNDYVLVWLADSTDHAYEGRVAKVKEKSILVLFDQSFHEVFQADSQFNVRFRFDRLHLRVWHRAVDTINLQLLWPLSQSESVQQNQKYLKQDIQWHDKQILQNPEQSSAIVNLLNKTNGSAPFLLFGPFGTGKTKCLIEYARQVLLLDPNCRILICAHSNSGTNKICEELMKTMTNEELFRLFSFNANPNRIGKIIDYTLRDEEKGVFVPPSMEILRSYRVILSTGDNAALLHGIGVGTKHFTHILVDEAAEFSEPGICVPLCLASEKTTVLLAGDSKQTSPRIFSRIAKHHGLAKSLMERLSSEPLYRENNKPNPMYYANLVRNYRSHPAIITFLSTQFYDNTLICCTKPREYQALQQWDKKGTDKTFPFLFYALDNSKEDREADSPSYFNMDEAITITRLVSNLLYKFGRNLQQEDICVVSASRKQTQKIIMLMKSRGMGRVEVGTTEALQGREFKAIFISTVRSNAELLQFDHQHNVGFVADEKRFNTAISRAVALVVVVGNSRLLAREPMWRNFIQYCSEHESYVNLMHGAGTGEEMIQELIDEEEEQKKQAEMEEKEAKKKAFLEKKRLAKLGSDSPAVSEPEKQLSPSIPNHNGHSVLTPNVPTNLQHSPQNGSRTRKNQPLYLPKMVAPPLQMSPQNTMLPVISQPAAAQYQPHAQVSYQLAAVEQLLQNQTHFAGQAQVQPQPQMNVQTNEHNEEVWMTVDKAKSVTLGQFLGKDLLVAFKDKGLKGYPPFTMQHHMAAPNILIVTLYVLRMNCQASTRDRFFIFDFYSMPQDPLIVAAGNLILFDSANMIYSGQGNELLSRLRLNVPDGYHVEIKSLDDRVIVTLFPFEYANLWQNGVKESDA